MYEKDRDLWSTPEIVNAILRDLVNALGMSRNAMNVSAADRGLVAGLLQIKRKPDEGDWTDCRNESGHNISGNMGELDGWQFKLIDNDAGVSAKFCLVVEKDAVFKKLVHERVWNKVPSVLVTAKVGWFTSMKPVLKILGGVDVIVSLSPSGCERNTRNRIRFS